MYLKRNSDVDCISTFKVNLIRVKEHITQFHTYIMDEKLRFIHRNTAPEVKISSVYRYKKKNYLQSLYYSRIIQRPLKYISIILSSLLARHKLIFISEENFSDGNRKKTNSNCNMNDTKCFMEQFGLQNNILP